MMVKLNCIYVQCTVYIVHGCKIRGERTIDVHILHCVNETSEIMNYLKIGPQNQNAYTQRLHMQNLYYSNDGR